MRAGEFIVRFNAYRLQEEHQQALEHALHAPYAPATSQPWQWVSRQNAATRYPTDFGVLAVDPQASASVRVRRIARVFLSSHCVWAVAQ